MGGAGHDGPTALHTRVGERDDVDVLPASLQIPAFRRLVAASTLSVTGSLMTFMVLPLVAWEATGSATTFGLVMTGGSIGMIVAMPFGGLIADRFDRRHVMLWGDLMAIIVTGAMLLAVLGQHWLLLPVLSMVQTLAGSLFSSAGPALRRDVLTDDVRAQGTAIQSGAISAANLLGPLAGVALYGLLGFAAVVVIDLVTFAISFLLLLGIRLPADVTHPAQDAADPEHLAKVRPSGPIRAVAVDLAGGLDVARRDAYVRWFLYSQLANGVGNGLLVLAVIPWLTQHLGMPASAWGTIVAAMGASSLVGSVVVARIGNRVAPATLMLVGLPPFLVGTCMLLGSPGSVRLHAAFVLIGLTNAALQIGMSTIQQQRVASTHMGRVSALNVMSFQATQGVATALGAGAIALFGPAAVIDGVVVVFIINSVLLARCARLARVGATVIRDDELTLGA